MNVPMTRKQLEVIRVIANFDEGGKPLDLDTVISRLPYETTKMAFQFVLRGLIKRELVEKLERQSARGKSRRFLTVTPLGLHRLESEFKRTHKPADRKTCEIDEIRETDKLLAQIEKDFNLEI